MMRRPLRHATRNRSTFAALRTLAAATALAASVAACDANGPAETRASAPAAVSASAPAAQAGAPAVVERRPQTRAQVYEAVTQMTALGRQLFFDPSLSGSGKLACASCHSPQHAFGPPK
ncbi:cytochrome-c peroxidase, partial [Burkholderia sp. MSMB2040]|uniref:cytochrome-c peroxidase n=1 Tax=Burkholderia sp. MSMB2040 TaxID=1637838 RepID=UPI000B16BE69